MLSGGQEARAALELLVERHHGPLIGYLYRFLGGDRQLAEDLTQETFVRLIKALGSKVSNYQRSRPFKPWLYSIATNLARDHFKAAATRITIGPVGTEQTNPLEYVVDQSPGPEAQALARERGEEVAVAIKQLAPEYRAAILLRFYGGMSLQEVALALDVPVGTVKSRLSVGCRKLRDLLVPEDVPQTPTTYGSRAERESNG